jgi:hypothetical protein
MTNDEILMPPAHDLRARIERSTTYFQPIVDLNTGQMLGAEPWRTA